MNRLIGTGVLIEPTLVLTAAHVPEGKEDLVWTETDGDKICIKEVIYYTEHIPGVYGFHDIAIIVLEHASDESPVELLEPDDSVYKRMPLTTVGHGHGIKRYSNSGTFGTTVDSSQTRSSWSCSHSRHLSGSVILVVQF